MTATAGREPSRLVYGFTRAGAIASSWLAAAAELAPPLTLVTAGELAAVTSPAPAPTPSPELAALQRYERVIRALHERGCDIAPARYGTTFPDEQAVSKHLTREADRYARALERIAGCTEFGVRVPIAVEAPRRASTPPPRAASGTAYLLARKAERDALSAATRAAERRVAPLLRRLDPILRARSVELVRARIGDGLDLSAALLVARDRGAALRRAFAEWSAGERAALTGPWPPFSFVAGADR